MSQGSYASEQAKEQMLVETPPDLRFDDINGLTQQQHRLEETLLQSVKEDHFGP